MRLECAYLPFFMWNLNHVRAAKRQAHSSGTYRSILLRYDKDGVFEQFEHLQLISPSPVFVRARMAFDGNSSAVVYPVPNRRPGS